MKHLQLSDLITDRIGEMQDENQERINAYAVKLRQRFSEEVLTLLSGYLMAQGIKPTEITLSEDFTSIEYND